MSQSDIETLEVEIDQAREVISLAADLRKLMSHPAFQKVIHQGYFIDEAVRLVALKMDRDFESPEAQFRLDKQMFGVGALNSYFNRMFRAAEVAQEAMDAMETTHNELLDEAV